MKPFTSSIQFENDGVLLLPLLADDFDALYAVASDPAIWAQHPQPDRWKAPVFHEFFEGALSSLCPFKIMDKETGTVAGSTRFYDYDPVGRNVFVGYTFYGVRHWGTGLNASVKHLMLDYAFRYVDTVSFHVGATNFRSRKAVEKLGAVKVADGPVAYHGDVPKWNFTYQIRRDTYMAQR